MSSNLKDFQWLRQIHHLIAMCVKHTFNSNYTMRRVSESDRNPSSCFSSSDTPFPFAAFVDGSFIIEKQNPCRHKCRRSKKRRLEPFFERYPFSIRSLRVPSWIDPLSSRNKTRAELKFGAPKNDVPKKALQFDNWCEKKVESRENPF